MILSCVMGKSSLTGKFRVTYMAKHNGLSFYRRRKRFHPKILKEIFSWIFGIVLALFLALVLNYFWGLSTYVVGVSMEPTLYNGQQIFIDRFRYTISGPKSGDVVVFLPNGNRNAHYYVKRVVAVPGDIVQITDGRLYVNGEICNLVEHVSDPGIAENELTMKKGEYFCIGDNPDNSEDSRSANIGPVQAQDVIGMVWFGLASESGNVGFVK